MTICIAAICQEREHGKPRVVLCSDTRVSSNTFLTDSALKIDVLGYNWAALQSGPWPGVNALSQRIGAHLHSGTVSSTETVGSAVRSGVAEFVNSSLYLDGAQY